MGWSVAPSILNRKRKAEYIPLFSGWFMDENQNYHLGNCYKYWVLDLFLDIMNHNLHFSKIKNTCFQDWEEKKQKTKQIRNWQKIFANYLSCKRLTFSLYYKLLKLCNLKETTFKNWAKDPNIHFIKENIQLVNKCMKRCSLVLRQMQIKTRMIHQFIPTGWV